MISSVKQFCSNISSELWCPRSSFPRVCLSPFVVGASLPIDTGSLCPVGMSCFVLSSVPRHVHSGFFYVMDYTDLQTSFIAIVDPHLNTIYVSFDSFLRSVNN